VIRESFNPRVSSLEHFRAIGPGRLPGFSLRSGTFGAGKHRENYDPNRDSDFSAA
jgi:hypothetical protein